MDAKRTYTPTEFAALFGKEKTWAYRQLYAGKVEAITEFGRIMIGASEITKIESTSARYLGKKKVAPKAAIKDLKESNELSSAEGGSQWVNAVRSRKRLTNPNGVQSNHPLRRRGAKQMESRLKKGMSSKGDKPSI